METITQLIIMCVEAILTLGFLRYLQKKVKEDCNKTVLNLLFEKDFLFRTDLTPHGKIFFIVAIIDYSQAIR